ncbi:uncharacterized protein LOC123290701 [Chrysoperla carnea]|uniref:uncharacterized protein LOC123290701 n=1 Tax=Chrysoperla carnea TaxID=189513 RepID=UPI001D0809EA|nr:uncharacterized protein LOC123290701 [Chrysoperla carnea]
MYRLTAFGYNQSPTIRYERLWNILIPITRFWGVATSVVLLGVGVEHAVHKHLLGIFFIFAALGIFFLEIVWAITLFLRLFLFNKDVDENGLGIRCWYKVLWVSSWKKTIIYVPLALLPLIYPYKLWLSYLVGIQLLILGILHFVLSGNKHRTTKPELLRQAIYYSDFDIHERFEEVFENTLLEVIEHDRRSLSEGIREDDALIDINL